MTFRIDDRCQWWSLSDLQIDTLLCLSSLYSGDYRILRSVTRYTLQSCQLLQFILFIDVLLKIIKIWESETKGNCLNLCAIKLHCLKSGVKTVLRITRIRS